MEAAAMTRSSEHIGFIDWAVASQVHPHELVCGDAYCVTQIANGVVICVIDGLGHGPEAAEASRAAIATISNHKDDAAEEIVARCHDALKATRGAVLSLAIVDSVHNRLSWVGIGNIEGILLHGEAQHEWLPLRAGIVGCRMPGIRAIEMPISPGDLLIMFSDGITSHVLDPIHINREPVEVAERIIRTHIRRTDDALVLVARYLGNTESIG
ncbi:MAG: SpoIIE family protein phosphatase [Candidatus Obscuribacterales bacterium]|nr:SpoIIE family protein phosphatase [Candidatus Obscuribacterales bacterium]